MTVTAEYEVKIKVNIHVPFGFSGAYITSEWKTVGVFDSVEQAKRWLDGSKIEKQDFRIITVETNW